MPKSKPTQVIVHRIELQEKERELAEMLVASKTVENVANSIKGIGIGIGLTTVAYFGIKVWEKVMSSDPDPPSLFDLGSNPEKMKEIYKEKGFWGGIWEIGTTPLVRPSDVWNWATE